MMKLTLLKGRGLCISFSSLGDSVAVYPLISVDKEALRKAGGDFRLGKTSARQGLRHY